MLTLRASRRMYCLVVHQVWHNLRMHVSGTHVIEDRVYKAKVTKGFLPIFEVTCGRTQALAIFDQGCGSIPRCREWSESPHWCQIVVFTGSRESELTPAYLEWAFLTQIPCPSSKPPTIIIALSLIQTTISWRTPCYRGCHTPKDSAFKQR